MLSQSEISKNLSQFIGTEGYHRLSPIHGKLVCTDGVNWLAEHAECYWLIDIIASYQHKLKNEYFQAWTLIKSGSGCTVTCTDGNSVKPLITQSMEYTDFPLNELKLYAVNDGMNIVAMLTSEY